MPAPPRLYDDLAHFSPHLSPPEQYEEEARLLRELIDEALGEPPAERRWSLLEMGAGGGHTLVHLKDTYDCTAADLAEPMLAHCNALNPGLPTVVGDMRDMRLGKQFDIVLLCDAIDYMLTEDDAIAALTTAAAHLKPGGVLLFAPTYVRETFVDREVADDAASVPGLAGDDELTYFTFVHDPDPADTQFEMILLYLLRDAQTRQVQVIEDRHACGLFGIEAWVEMARRAGLSAEALAEPGTDAGTDAGGGRADGEGPSAWSVLFRAAPAVQ